MNTLFRQRGAAKQWRVLSENVIGQRNHIHLSRASANKDGISKYCFESVK